MENKVLARNEIETDEKCSTLLSLNELKLNYKNPLWVEGELERTVVSKKGILANNMKTTKKCFSEVKIQNFPQINNLESNDNKNLIKNDKYFYKNSDDVNLNEAEVSSLIKNYL